MLLEYYTNGRVLSYMQPPKANVTAVIYRTVSQSCLVTPQNKRVKSTRDMFCLLTALTENMSSVRRQTGVSVYLKQ